MRMRLSPPFGGVRPKARGRAPAWPRGPTKLDCPSALSLSCGPAFAGGGNCLPLVASPPPPSIGAGRSPPNQAGRPRSRRHSRRSRTRGLLRARPGRAVHARAGRRAKASVSGRGPAHRLPRRRRHHRRPSQGLGRRGRARRPAERPQAPTPGARRQSQGRGLDVLRRLFQEGRARRRPADHLPLQRRPRLLDHVAAHGRLRTAPGRHRRRQPHAGRALRAGRQRLQPAGRQRPGVHRRAGHRLLPHRRQGQGKGLLGRRRRRLRLRPVHHGLPVQVRPLEFAQIPVRRKLRHAALGGAGQRPGDRRGRRLQRRDPALADPQLRLSASTGRSSIPAATRPMSPPCRPMPPPPGTTTARPAAARPTSKPI